MHQAWRNVGCHADVALAAAQHQCNSGCVVARIHGKTFGCFFDQPLRAFDIGCRFLDANDAWHLCQPHHRGVRHIGHGATRHVVQNAGQVASGLSNGFEVLVLAFLRGLVVVGYDLQLAVCANASCKLGQLNRLSGRIGTATGHDGHALGGLLNRHANDFAMLLNIHRG